MLDFETFASIKEERGNNVKQKIESHKKYLKLWCFTEK